MRLHLRGISGDLKSSLSGSRIALYPPAVLAGKREFMRGMYLEKGKPRARARARVSVSRVMEIRDEANANRKTYRTHLPAFTWWKSANVYLRKSFSRCTAGNLHGKYGFMFHGL